MVRLMLVLAPVMCILSGIAVSHLLTKYIKNLNVPSGITVSSQSQSIRKSGKSGKSADQQTSSIKNEIAIGFVVVMTFLLITYTFHCTWVTSEAYSSPRYLKCFCFNFFNIIIINLSYNCSFLASY